MLKNAFSKIGFLVHNVDALAMWRHSVFRPPESMLTKNTKDDDKINSSDLFVGWN